MLAGEKILMTGANGVVGLPIATLLAKSNEVWAIARFGDGAQTANAMNASSAPREVLEAKGITTRRVDLAAPDFRELPDDFTYVLHLAHTRLGSEFQRAIQVNAVGAGHVLRHCRKAKAALVVSSAAIYSPQPDPFALHHEDGDLGKASTPWAPSSPVSKVSLEAIARFCAEAFGLRTTIARLNTIYGSFGGRRARPPRAPARRGAHEGDAGQLGGGRGRDDAGMVCAGVAALRKAGPDRGRVDPGNPRR